MKQVFQEYLAYLRDNPERYWFKRKLYGWGWTPARWQGWAVIGVFALAILALTLRLDPQAQLKDVIWSFFAPLLALVVLVIGIAYRTGESPRWQWGLEKKDTNHPNDAIK
jgi:hypothetical protein